MRMFMKTKTYFFKGKFLYPAIILPSGSQLALKVNDTRVHVRNKWSDEHDKTWFGYQNYCPLPETRIIGLTVQIYVIFFVPEKIRRDIKLSPLKRDIKSL